MRPADSPTRPERAPATAVRQALVYLTPAALGVALLGLVGFAPYPAVHDTFHDVRHASGFPCH